MFKACGGDGTINTIAKLIVGSKVLLGILPRGSGNGLAAHLKIADSLEQLQNNLVSGKTKAIDCGSVNGHYFFSNFAIGYPADVINRYHKDEKRGLLTYLTHSLKSLLLFKKRRIIVNNDDGKRHSLLISNTRYLG